MDIAEPARKERSQATLKRAEKSDEMDDFVS
jgi:hypothetical protein